MSQSALEKPFNVPASLLEEAASRVDRLEQDAELAIRREMLQLDRLFERIGDEVAAELNEQQAPPDTNVIARVVRGIVEKYFGRSVEVEVAKVPGETAFEVRSRFSVKGGRAASGR